MLSAPGALSTGRLRVAASTSSFIMGSGEGSCGGLRSLCSKLVSGCIGKLYNSLKYSVHLFNTSKLSVRRLPSLSSIAVVLFCFSLVSSLIVLYAFLLLPYNISFSISPHFSTIHLSFASFILLLTCLLFYTVLQRLDWCICPF